MKTHPYPIRTIIADDHHIRRQTFCKYLDSEPDIQIVRDVSDSCSAARLTQEMKPDILLLDFGLSQNFEAQAPHGFARHFSPTRIAFVVTDIERLHILEAFRLGANGIVLRTAALRRLVKDIRNVMSDTYWLDSERVNILLEALRERLSQSNGRPLATDYGLTRRELDIITKVATGHSNKEVGETFSISERTVKHHLTNIYNKVGVSSRLQLALFAVNRHLADTEGPTTVGSGPDC